MIEAVAKSARRVTEAKDDHRYVKLFERHYTRMAFSMPVGDIVNFAVQQLRLGGHLELRNHQNVRHWRRFQFSSSI